MPRGSAPPELGAEGISRVAGRGVSRLTKKLIVKGAASVSGELTCLPRDVLLLTTSAFHLRRSSNRSLICFTVLGNAIDGPGSKA